MAPTGGSTRNDSIKPITTLKTEKRGVGGGFWSPGKLKVRGRISMEIKISAR